MKVLKYIIESFFKYLQGKKRFYSLFYFMYLTGLKGIEHGRNYGNLTTSGELNVIKILKSHVKYPLIIDGGAEQIYLPYPKALILPNQATRFV